MLPLMTAEIRVRYAPSPTGRLHVGGARTALFNWAFARRKGGTFVLRVEDTDRERSSQEFEEAIYEGMRWLGLDWDEGPEKEGDCGPYRQSERTEAHLGVAARLRQAGWAYPCFCSAERLEELREGQKARGENPRYDGLCRDLTKEEVVARVEAGETPVLRFRVPEGSTRFDDHIRGTVEVQNADVDDWVMVRGDGSPTYNFVCVVDDSEMRITHVIRGEDHLTNTPKQILLYQALGLPTPEFAHLPLMLGTDKKKLSKRSGHTAVQDYRDLGYPAAAMWNFLCLQGWALDGENDVFGVDEVLANFELGDVSKGGSIFDPEKLLWMAGEYVRKESVEELAGHCAPFVTRAGLLSEGELSDRGDWYRKLVGMEQERIRLYAELPERIAYAFAADGEVAFDDDAVKNATKRGTDTLKSYREWIAPRLEGGVDEDALRDDTKAWVKEAGVKFPDLFQPLRCALTGRAGGPDLFEVMGVLGAEATLARIDAGLERLG